MAKGIIMSCGSDMLTLVLSFSERLKRQIYVDFTLVFTLNLMLAATTTDMIRIR